MSLAVLQNAPAPPDGGELPAYSPREWDAAPPARVLLSPAPREPVTHTYALTNRQGRAWARLNVLSKARAPESLPRVLQGEPITGSVELDLVEEMPMKAVTVTVTGELISDTTERYIFAEASTTVWSGAPKEKLKGSFHWPFSLELPSTVQLPDGSAGATRTYTLPCSFSARFSCATVLYRMTAVISHGSLFKADNAMGTNLSYTAKTQPGPPSVARQLAYEEQSPLIGPDGDPSGWYTLDRVTVKGTAFNTRPVEISYTLSLARPLSYTRGSVIPLHLSIDCADVQVLDLVSSPQASVVRLVHTVTFGYKVSGGLMTPSSNTKIDSKMYLANVKPSTSMSFNKNLSNPVQTATWWTLPAYDKQASERRELQGEMNLSPTMQATAHLGQYSHTYEVVLSPPEVVGFVASESKKLQSIPVEICTMYANGPRPIVYSPPTYVDTTPEEESRTRNRASGISPDAAFY